MKRKPDHDLNRVFQASVAKKRASVHSFGGGEVWFDEIERRIVEAIQDPAVRYVLCSSPWFSSQPILKALGKKGGCSILTNRDGRVMKGSAVRNRAFEALKSIPNLDRVRVCSKGRGRTKSIPHQKFLVMLGSNSRPLRCLVGSYNFSGGASTNLEVVTFHKEERIANILGEEWKRVYGISSTYLK